MYVWDENIIFNIRVLLFMTKKMFFFRTPLTLGNQFLFTERSRVTAGAAEYRAKVEGDQPLTTEV